MTKCSILWCGAKKDEKCPELTLHSFPRNVNLRKRWLDAVGVENIKPNLKAWYICPLHFEESCFNRTLDVIRLHDNTIPSIFLKSEEAKKIIMLKNKCTKQKLKIKRLIEKVRKRDKKIAILSDIIKDLQEKN